MNPDAHQTLFAIQSATEELIDLALLSVSDATPAESEALESEVHSTMLSLVAASVLAHGKFSASPGKQALLRILLAKPRASMTDERVLNEYASRWSSVRTQIPLFLHSALAADLHNGTQTARRMLLFIQIIGNNAAASDGDFVAKENLLVRDYLAHLENHINAILCSR